MAGAQPVFTAREEQAITSMDFRTFRDFKGRIWTKQQALQTQQIQQRPPSPKPKWPPQPPEHEIRTYKPIMAPPAKPKGPGGGIVAQAEPYQISGQSYGKGDVFEVPTDIEVEFHAGSTFKAGKWTITEVDDDGTLVGTRCASLLSLGAAGRGQVARQRGLRTEVELRAQT
jgi:hypothetical protein